MGVHFGAITKLDCRYIITIGLQRNRRVSRSRKN
jgi:hypothetical protein